MPNFAAFGREDRQSRAVCVPGGDLVGHLLPTWARDKTNALRRATAPPMRTARALERGRGPQPFIFRNAYALLRFRS